MALRIVAKGTWLYGGTVDTPVDVVALDYDWWHCLDEADAQLEPGQEPTPTGPDGCLYYVRFKWALELSEPTWPDSSGYPQLQDAMQYAESKVVGGIRWEAV